MNGTQIGILKESNEIRLGRFLESENRSALETEIILEILSLQAAQTVGQTPHLVPATYNLANQALKR
jgi:hypothetical protein